MTFLRWTLALCALLGSLVASPVLAQAPDKQTTEKARAAYGRGQDLFRRGDYKAAQASFEEAYKYVPNPVVLLGIAEAQQRLELWTDAVVSLTRYLQERPNAPDKRQVKKQIAAIRKRPGKLYIASTPPGAAIIIDGEETGKNTPDEVRLKAGDHQVKLVSPDLPPNEQLVTVLIGANHNLNVNLEPTPEPDATEAIGEDTGDTELGADEQASDDGDSGGRTAAWVAVGLGGAGLVAGVSLGVMALGEKSDFDDNPTEASADRGERLALFADVGFALALAGGVTAVVLFVTGRDKGADEQPSQAALKVAPVVTRNSGGVAAQLSF